MAFRYENGKALCCSNYGRKEMETEAISGLDCRGEESSVSECPTRGGYCADINRNYGSVYCYNGSLSAG